MSAAVIEAPARPSTPAAEDRTVPSVTKALQLLDAFREASGPLGVSEIARLAGVPKSTAFRLLSYLEQAGFVERAGKEYLLGGRLFELGNSVPIARRGGLRDLAMPHLSELFVATGKVVQLGVLEGSDVVYLEKITGRDTVDVPTAVGTRMSAGCTALGKAMLAFSGRETIGHVLHHGLVRRTRYSHADPARFLTELRRVHEERIAFDREEVQVGLVCVAAPILRKGRAVAAVSVSGRATHFNPAMAVAHVRRTADAISRELD